jgi:hypothetical protein
MLKEDHCCFKCLSLLNVTSKKPSLNTLTHSSLLVMAVEALDKLVASLVKATELKLSAEFFDWIADEATPIVELSVARSFDNPRFIATLDVGNPKTAIALWVRHWVSPLIIKRFETPARDMRIALEFAFEDEPERTALLVHALPASRVFKSSTPVKSSRLALHS